MEDRCIMLVLRHLVYTAEEERVAFRLAAEAVDRADYKILFAYYSAQRGAFVDALRRFAAQYGGDLADIRPRQSPRLPSSDSILAECAREEARAVSEYRKALDQPLPHDLQTEIGAQSLEVKAALDRVRHLARAA